MPNLGTFKTCSLILGLLVGLFIYLSTLGAEFVAVMLWGRDILEKTSHELVFFSLGWNLVTTLTALIILSALRRLVSTIFSVTMTMSHNQSQSRTQDNIDNIMCELLSYLEGRFAVGALVGICVSWNLTNLVLGMRPQIIQSCVILAVACLWCRMTVVLLGSPGKVLIHESLPTAVEQTTKKQAKQISQDDDKMQPLLHLV